MRGFLAAVPFLLVPATDDTQAQDLHAALRRKMESAQTLSVDFSLSFSVAGGPAEEHMSGSIRIKGTDRWQVTVRATSSRRPDKSVATSMFWNGDRVAGLGPPLPKELTPKEVASQFRHTLADHTFAILRFVEPRGSPSILGSPDVAKVRDGGSETVGGVKASILLYDVRIDNQTLSIKAWVDPAGLRILKRELTAHGQEGKLEETFATFSFDTPLEESVFEFATRHRLAEARAKELARSVTLYGQFIGRTPASFEDLTHRPEALAETAVWPASGFVLGGVLPKDPWGRPYTLRREGDRLIVASLGADGKPGGTGEDADIAVEAVPSPRMPVTAPTPRLKSQYEARVTLHLVAAAVEAYRETYGALPRKNADLFEKTRETPVWPEEGWIPDGRLPLDPWGEEVRLMTEASSALVQIQNPKAHLLAFKQLTEEERSALERGARPVLSPGEREDIQSLVSQLRDDDLGTRQKAHDALRRYGRAADEALAAYLAQEKDLEVQSRLKEVRRTLPRPVPPWRMELATLSQGVFAEGERGNISKNERIASTTLKTFCAAQADFRANDRDGNLVNDFWTADVAGLYSLKDASGQSIKLIELSAALADGAPLEAGAAGGRIPELTQFGVPSPKAGYWFRAMETRADQTPPEMLRTDTGGNPTMGKVHHSSMFGFSAYPAEYGVSGTRTFIVNENNTIFWKDTQGEPVLEWPSDADFIAEGWSRFP